MQTLTWLRLQSQSHRLWQSLWSVCAPVACCRLLPCHYSGAAGAADLVPSFAVPIQDVIPGTWRLESIRCCAGSGVLGTGGSEQMGIHRLRSPVLLSVLRLRMGCGAVHPLGQAVIDTHAVRQRVAVQARAYRAYWRASSCLPIARCHGHHSSSRMTQESGHAGVTLLPDDNCSVSASSNCSAW